MNDAALLAALLRGDLRFFIWKSFQTILPGTPYLPNWHIDAIVYELMRVRNGEILRLPHQSAAALAQIDFGVGCLCRMASRSRSHTPGHRRELLD